MCLRTLKGGCVCVFLIIPIGVLFVFVFNLKVVYISKGGWVADSDGALRCSDCNLFPAADECGDDDDDKKDDNDDIVKMGIF